MMFIDAGLVVIRVTTGAIRLVGRELPDYCLAVSGVAGLAAQIDPMVARIVAGCMREVDGCPLVGVVAGIALQ
jgi:hypothetical protein